MEESLNLGSEAVDDPTDTDDEIARLKEEIRNAIMLPLDKGITKRSNGAAE